MYADIKTDWQPKLSHLKIDFGGVHLGGPRGGGPPKLCQNIYLLNISWYHNRMAP